MIHNDLLIRMMHRDMDAFLEMTDKYSWAVHSYIRGKISDKRKVEAVFNETMNSFYKGLHENQDKDPMEALLLIYADKVCQAAVDQSFPEDPVIEENFRPGKSGMVADTPVQHSEPKKKGGFFFSLAVILLLAAIVAVIWFIIGQLMSMNLIPSYDLGYTWFHTNVFPWF